MINSNYIYSFVFEFPKLDSVRYSKYNGFKGFSANQNIFSDLIVYSDVTQRNARQIIFEEETNIPNQKYNVTGFVPSLGLTTKQYELASGETQTITDDEFWYVNSISPVIATTGLKVGNGFGSSIWYMHDGSTTKHYVTFENSAKWTIEGSDQKFFLIFEGTTVSADVPYDSVAQAYNINTNLTDQTASTAFPIVVQDSIAAYRIKVSQDEDKEFSGLQWRMTAKPML